MKAYLVLAAVCVLAAQPASAQYRSPWTPPAPYSSRGTSSPPLIDQLARRIDSDLRMQIISRDDWQRLRRCLAAAGGLVDEERFEDWRPRLTESVS